VVRPGRCPQVCGVAFTGVVTVPGAAPSRREDQDFPGMAPPSTRRAGAAGIRVGRLRAPARQPDLEASP
jgi:hypothetical protein